MHNHYVTISQMQCQLCYHSKSNMNENTIWDQFVCISLPKMIAIVMVTLVLGADTLDRLTRDLTVELEELVSYCRQDLDLTETT